MSMLFPITKGSWTLRGCDGQGCGNFGARRGSGARTRKHRGLDVVTTAGAMVHAPIDGILRSVGPGRPGLHGAWIQGTGQWAGFQVRMYYFVPKVRGRVTVGQVIGRAQDIKPTYGASMTNHIHLELRVGGRAMDPAKHLIRPSDFPW